jgi:aldose 1-epimerase
MTNASAAHGAVTKESFGATPDGTPVEIYTLKSDAVEVRIMTYGARVVSIKTADREGKVADVTLGYDDLAGYLADRTYFGAIVGRVGNRLAKGKFTLDGQEYNIPLNNGVNSLHGGMVGFDKLVWTAKEVEGGVEMTLVSPDGDQGYPGTLTAQVRYTLQDGTLSLDFTVTTDKATVVNLTNHTYFNLSGEGTILGAEAQVNADRFIPVDSTQIPSGELRPVVGTPFDFRVATAIGARIDQDDEQLKMGHGYDHNWALNGTDGVEKIAAVVHDPKTGRVLTVTTTEPGVQFYTGNSIPPGLKGKNGLVYGKHWGFCLEAQHFPDSPNHAEFPTIVLRPGETLRHRTTFAFSVR